MVMLHSDLINGHVPLDLHIRTTIRSFYSSIETAALRVGNVTLEMDAKLFYVNDAALGDEALPFETDNFVLSGPVGDKNLKHRRTYTIKLNERSSLLVRKTKSFVSLSVKGHASDFAQSYGLLGDFYTGDAKGRDGRLIHDWNEYGLEWQVREDEPSLFRSVREPQHPHAPCKLPGVTKPNRRLGSNKKDLLARRARIACAHAGQGYDDCVMDVLVTGDLDFAGAW